MRIQAEARWREMGGELSGLGSIKAISDLIYSVSIREANRKKVLLLTFDISEECSVCMLQDYLKNCPNTRSRNMYDGIT